MLSPYTSFKEGKKERRKKGWKEINTEYQWKFDNKCQNIIVVAKEFFTIKIWLN